MSTPFEDAITALGTTADEVTAKLKEMGIKGRRWSARWCPIAEYLKASGFPHVTVGCGASRYANHESLESEETVKLPMNVESWIREFDGGSHSEFWQE